MANFRLIQRGFFTGKSRSLFTDPDEAIELDYMGAAEFEFEAIPKAYRRFMYHFEEYKTSNTGFYTQQNEELLLFCRRNHAIEIMQMLKAFMQNPYRLKEPSYLEKITEANEDTECDFSRTNFWWCIDIKSHGDWMAFLQPQAELFMQAAKNDYQNWWLKMSPKIRQAEYNTSLHW